MMTTQRSQNETLLKDVEALLGANSSLSSTFKSSILSQIERQIQSQNETPQDVNHNVKLVQIPSIGEFGELLDIVSPESSNGAFWKHEDLVLLNISKNVSIVFYDDNGRNDENKTDDVKQKQKEKEHEKEQEREPKQKLRLGKLVFGQDEENNDDKRGMLMAGSALSMGNFDEFNCLLIGCCIALAQSIGNINNDTTFLDGIFANIQPFFGKSLTSKDVSFVKEEFKLILTLLIELLNFGNDKDTNNKASVKDNESLIVRLAMLLGVSSNHVTQLSFVKNYIEATKQQDKKGSEVKKGANSNSDDVVVTRGSKKEKEKEKVNDETGNEEDSVESKILNLKRVVDKSLLKMIIYQIGCFIDLYNLMKEEESKMKETHIIGKFISYFYFLENKNNNNNNDSSNNNKSSHSLLSMKHGINGDSLLNIARKSNDDGNLYKALLKFVESNETFNDKFREYGKYFNERSTLMRTKMDQVELF